MQAFSSSKIDDFVKSPTSVLRCILRHCLAELGQADVPVSTPHSSGFARLAFESFYFVARLPTFYGTIKNYVARALPVNMLGGNLYEQQKKSGRPYGSC
jgi:hypothetical protein